MKNPLILNYKDRLSTMFFASLPDELKVAIFSRCSIRTILNCASVCKDWEKITNDDSLWHKQINKLANQLCEKANGDTRSWKTIFKQRYHELFILADQLYFVLYSNKPNVIMTYDYATDVIHGIHRIVNQAISPRALFSVLLKNHHHILIQTDNHRHLALHWFMACGFSEAVELLLNAGELAQTCTGNVNLNQTLVNFRNKEGFTPLHFALFNYPQFPHERLIEEIQLGLAYGVDLTIADEIDGTNFLEDFQTLWETAYITDDEYQAVNALIQNQASASAEEQLTL